MTELRLEGYEIPAAELGPENPLPFFRSRKESREITVDPNVPEDVRRHLGWHTGHRLLPYRLQDSYTRERHPRRFVAAVLENEYLRATVLPELGGRLVSLVSKPTGRELLDRNPVFQPRALALRNAWFRGGIEWNTGQPGHHYLTCSPLFAARVEGPEGGPVLRIYEWERAKRFPWQVDLLLPPGSPLLFARIRVVNPHDQELAMYWWTNMSVPERPDVRVIVPTAEAIHHVGQVAFRMEDLPLVDGADWTYPTNSRASLGLFFRIPDGQRPWITALDAQGRGLVQTSTERLRGRKLFCWGMTAGGRHWQEFLSVPGQNHSEIQAGLARTQDECLPMPARAEWTWTEAYGLLEADPAEVHSPDWERARRAAEEALARLLPEEQHRRWDRELAAVTDAPCAEILHRGAGWGALERRRVAVSGAVDRVPAALWFGEETLGPEQEPWLALLERGELPSGDPQQEPGAWLVQPEWEALLRARLEQAAGRRRPQAAGGEHWLAWLHLGNMRREALDFTGAREAWEQSLRERRNGWALRNLAVLESEEGRPEAALELWEQAWEQGPRLPALAVEYAQALLRNKRHEDVLRFVAGLPSELRDHERIVLLRANAALRVGQLELVEPALSREFVTIYEGETTLSDLWFGYQEQKLAAQEGVAVDNELRRRVRQQFPPPPHLDFRMRVEE